jgi:DNA repair protein RecO (recombination protein O)
VKGVLFATPALVVRLVDRGESDRVVTLLTERAGLVAVSARGVRKGSKRFGSLEPMHRLAVVIEHPEREIARLEEARIDAMRLRVTAHLEASLAAGFWLRLARALAHPHGDDGDLFRITDRALALLDEDPERHADLSPLVPFAMLAAVGYALELECCVVCGKECPEDRAAAVDARRGGLLCRACGFASLVLPAAARRAIRRAQDGTMEPLGREDAELARRLAQDVVAQHIGHTVR